MSHRPVITPAVLWGLGGALGLILWAIVRLTPVAWEGLRGNLGAHHWVFLVLWCVFMGWSEGYRGFQLGYARRVSRRSLELGGPVPWWQKVLAPMVVMGLIAAPRRRMIVSWSLILMLVVLIRLVRMLPQPWRGLVDVGVVLGLAWGVVATALWWVHGVRGGAIPLPVRDIATTGPQELVDTSSAAPMPRAPGELPVRRVPSA